MPKVTYGRPDVPNPDYWRMATSIVGIETSVKNLELPRLDSNQDKESQNLLCYRYTTG